MRHACLTLLIALLLLACGRDGPPAEAAGRDSGEPARPGDIAGSGDGPAADTLDRPRPSRDLQRDLLHMDLALDLAAHTAVARVRVETSASGAVTFEAGGLSVQSVRLGGQDLSFQLDGGLLDVGVPPGAVQPVIEVRYGFKPKEPAVFEGYMSSGSTLLWPYHCGNLFPCHSAPADGLTFSLALSGLPAGATAVHAPPLPSPAPAYAVAFAVGDYAWVSLGQTPAGTELGYYTLPQTKAHLVEGTAHLLAHFGWLEQTLGPYAFGPRAGPVAVDWGLFAVGGIEHHPYWHVSIPALTDPLVHAHEAAHGWFGTSVRIACWEDLVLSEGLATYLAARAVEATEGQAAGEKVWAGYEGLLKALLGGGKDIVVWPQSCGQVDVIKGGLFTQVTYMKGALFLRALSAKTGVAALDAALGGFFAKHKGGAARMQELLDHIESATGVDPVPLAEAWLRSKGVPAGG